MQINLGKFGNISLGILWATSYRYIRSSGKWMFVLIKVVHAILLHLCCEQLGRMKANGFAPKKMSTSQCQRLIGPRMPLVCNGSNKTFWILCSSGCSMLILAPKNVQLFFLTVLKTLFMNGSYNILGPTVTSCLPEIQPLTFWQCSTTQTIGKGILDFLRWGKTIPCTWYSNFLLANPRKVKGHSRDNFTKVPYTSKRISK